MTTDGRSPLAALAERPAPLLVLWLVPAAAIVGLTGVLGLPAAALGADRPTPAEAVAALARLMALLYLSLFLIVLAAGPTARVLAGEPLARALRASLRAPLVGVAGLLALLLTAALLLTLLPGLLASFVNPLMAQIFLTVGTIGGAALAIGLFGRGMCAPALAAAGASAAEALDRSRADARAHRGFGAALGLGVVLALFALAGGALSVLAGPAWVQAAARVVPLWLGLALVASATAARHRAHGGAEGAAREPTLGLRTRPSRCPRCGALASAPVEGGPVACAACGLRASLR